MNSIRQSFTPIHRRAFLRGSSLVLSASALTSSNSLFADELPPTLRVALVTDMHYADKDSVGTRHYRETLPKLAEAATQFATDKPDFLVELGDLIDAADSPEVELRYLAKINEPFAAIAQDRHYVLGNHCVDMLTKEEFLGHVGQKESYYSFDRKGVHFVVLDACFRKDGKPYGRKNSAWDDANIPESEIDWLRQDLKKAEGKVIVLAHQRLDGNSSHCVKNAAEVRSVLEGSKKVLAVFQGHSHQNATTEIEHIHYCTLVAMVEGSGETNNSYTLLDIHSNGTLHVRGFRKQKNYDWS